MQSFDEVPCGPDLLFGLVLAAIGTAFHWSIGSVNLPMVFQLLLGGIPGVVLGCLVAPRVPANKLRTVVAMVAIFAGLQLNMERQPNARSKAFGERRGLNNPTIQINREKHATNKSALLTGIHKAKPPMQLDRYF